MKDTVNMCIIILSGIKFSHKNWPIKVRSVSVTQQRTNCHRFEIKSLPYRESVLTTPDVRRMEVNRLDMETSEKVVRLVLWMLKDCATVYMYV